MFFKKNSVRKKKNSIFFKNTSVFQVKRFGVLVRTPKRF